VGKAGSGRGVESCCCLLAFEGLWWGRLKKFILMILDLSPVFGILGRRLSEDTVERAEASGTGQVADEGMHTRRDPPCIFP
jgi:hypothetical protein